MIDRSHGLPLRRQAEVLQLSRSTFYHEPRPVPAADLAAMRRIYELHLDHPFAGTSLFRSPAADRGSMTFAAVRGAALRAGYALPARRPANGTTR